MTNYFRYVAVLLLFSFAGSPSLSAEEVRSFTDKQGRSVRGSVLGAADGSVELHLENGGRVKVALSQLSDADVAYIEGLNSNVAVPESAPATATALVAGTPMGPWDHSENVRGLTNADFRIWLPSDSEAIRGMIVLVPGANGDGRGQATDRFWQDLAQEIGFGLIACFFKDENKESTNYSHAHNGSGAAVLAALDAAAEEWDRQELKSVPLLLWGHSAGGQFNYNFACWRPQRTLAFVVNKGGFYYDTAASPATRATPAILFMGSRDTEVRNQNITKLFQTYRSRGALWALCEEKDTGHDVGKSREIARTFFKSVVAVRMDGAGAAMGKLDETSGWLGDPSNGEISTASSFSGNKRRASWFPDEATALAWQAAVR